MCKISLNNAVNGDPETNPKIVSLNIQGFYSFFFT